MLTHEEKENLPLEFKTLSPMYQHYFSIQLKYPEAIVCYQVGDFYEIWEKNNVGHVESAHRVLDIKKTTRNKSDPEAPGMCGFNVGVSEFYFKKLVNNGHTVVVVSQKYNGKNSDNNKGVPRYIEKILTPGTIVENLSEEKSNYYACLFKQEDIVGISLVDLSTGEVKVTEILEKDLNDYLNNFNPTEILICGDIKIDTKKFKFTHSKKRLNIKNLADSGKILSHIYDLEAPTSNPEYHISTLGLDKWRFAALSLANLVDHLSESDTEYSLSLLRKLAKPSIYIKSEHLLIPLNGLRSLEIFEGQNQNEQDSLANCLDKCYTAMGRRKLREWLREPLISSKDIMYRHDIVDNYINKSIDYLELKDVYDIARMSRRIFLGTLDPMDIYNLYSSLKIIKNILEKEENDSSELAKNILKKLTDNIDFQKLSLETESDFLYLKGELSNRLSKERKNWKNQEKEMLELKKYYDKIIANHFEGSSKRKSFKDIIKLKDQFKLKGPKGFNVEAIRNKIKFKVLTNEVEVIDSKWLDVSNKCFSEMQLYKLKAQREWKNFLAELSDEFGNDLGVLTEEISEIDVLNNFARISKERGYNRVEIVDTNKSFIDVKNIRHPIVENNFKLEEVFIPNDVKFKDDKNIICIYGANSSGKSTLLKSLALNIIMNQIGCFCALSENSKMSTFKNILTRMTTYDSLSEGLSTFTMEMKELKESLRYMNEKSLFLFDEIGRGTSVEDGESLAFATLDYLSKESNLGLTFFATHYHKLVPSIINYKNIEVCHMDTYLNEDGKLSFSRKLFEGKGSGSYGIEVAGSCGIPEEMIRVAKNYSKTYAPLKTSRYNSNVKGLICPICENNPVQETHHIIDQKQGRVKEVVIDGIKKHINHKDNLLMICGACHNKITRKELILNRKE